MIITVFAMSGILAPLTGVNAATASAGDLIKMEGLSSVYYLGSDGKRYVFPNESTFLSWYGNFDSVVTVPQAELESYSLGANVTVRPGTKLVKITTNPKVYAVEKGGILKWVPDESTAVGLFGTNWAQRVIDVPDSYFTNYADNGGSVSSSAYPQGSLVKFSGDTDVYHVNEDGTASRVANEAAFEANRFNWADVIEASASITRPSSGAEISGANSMIIDTSSSGAGVGIVAGAGTGLTVSLSSGTPGSASIPQSASNVPFSKYNFTASNDGAVIIQSIIVTRNGVGSASDFSRVYLYDGTSRLTSGKTVNSSSNQATFTNLNYTVLAGTTKTLTVVADIASSGNNNYLSIASASDVTTNGASVSGSFPVSGNTMNIVAVTAGTIVVAKNGTITNPTIGQQDVKIAQFQLSPSDEDVDLEQINLTVKGTISGNEVTDLKLYYNDGTLLASDNALDSNELAEFVLNSPYRIADGNDKIFYVTADLEGKNAETVNSYLANDTDLVARGATYGFGAGVTRTSYDNTTAGTDSSQVTLQGGDVTFSLNGPVASDVSVNSNDVEVLNVTLTTQSAITVKQIDLVVESVLSGAADNDSDNGDLIRGDSTEANIKDIKIRDGSGNTLMGPNSLTVSDDTGDVDQTLSFTDSFDMAAGESKVLSITIDIDNDAPDDQEYRVTLDIDTNLDIEDSEGNTLATTNIVPSTDLVGNTFTTKSATLTVAKSSSISSATKVRGTNEVELLATSFTAGSASEITITSLSLTGYIDSSVATAGNCTANTDFAAGSDDDQASSASECTYYFKDVVTSLSIYDGSVSASNKIGSTKSANTSGVATFDGLSWTIPASETKTLIVVGDLSNSGTYGTAGTRIKVDFATPSSDITSQDQDSNDISASGSAPNGTTTDTVGTYAQITLSNGGTLAADIPTDTPNTDIAIAGGSGSSFSKIKLTASREGFIASKLALKNSFSSTVGDYDDNISAIYLTYPTNATGGATETKAGTLTNGIATFSGLNVYVPDPDIAGNNNYAIIEVTADLNSTANSQSDAGDAPSFTLSLAGDFEATGISSGNKIYEQTLGITDASSAVASGVLLNGAVSSASATSLTVDTTDATTVLVAGDIILINSEAIYVSSVDSATALTVIRGVNNTTAATHADNDAISVYGTADTTLDVLATNAMNVQGTKLTLAAQTPAHGGQNSSEEVMKFTATADSNGDAQVRQGDVNDATANTTDFNTSAFAGTFTATDALSTVSTGGVGGSAAFQRETSGGVDGAGIIFTFGSAADLSDYTGICFATKASEAANTITLTLDDDDGTDQTVVSATMVANEWQTVCGDFTKGTGNDNVNAISTLTWAVTDSSAVNAATYDIDNIVLYKEKINVDLSLNANATAGATTAYLKQNGSTVATGQAVWSADADTGRIVFVPTGTYGDIEINGTDTFTVESDTTIFTDSTSTENLTTTVDLGNSSTAGDVYWYDVEGASTVTYTGVNSTDKISSTVSY